jgi:type IV secretory pathway ATPase VirB11/archaellum biosynthesis ATPase
MCQIRGVERGFLVMDCAMCPYEYLSPACINSHLRDLSMMTDVEFSRMRYEEEIIIEYDEAQTAVIKEYVGLARQIELFFTNPDTFGRKEDDAYVNRKQMFSLLYEEIFQNPLTALRRIEEYKEAEPTRAIYMEGYQRFNATLQKIREQLLATKMYSLVKEAGDVRSVFLSFSGMKTAAFVETIMMGVPPEAKPIDAPGSKYPLQFGNDVEIFELVGKEANFYMIKNSVLAGLSDQLKRLLRQTIATNMQPVLEKVDYATLYETKLRGYRMQFLDAAAAQKIPITTTEALVMAKETVNWTLGMGSPIENIALDRENITDIYIDSENAPIYLEHMQFGICHTPWRYNHQLLDYAILNATLGAKAGKRLDERNPIIDVMLNRLNMRCHLEGPPATFGELHAALRIMKPTPFTYSQYLSYNSMTGFYAGYDDTMVSLGCSEGVMGVKGCGKTSLTAAKISAIGTKRRIIPIQDIEEIPVRVYRKRGFHIGAEKVAEEEEEKTALSLVRMTSAALRMGDAAIIINEMRSRTAIQGVINLLNTQPGVFILYNFHAESLKDVQDRFELVFGIPSAAMFATDRYTFMHKYRFGRKERMYRVIRKNYESDPVGRKFIETFSFQRGADIKSSSLECNFLKNPEARAWSIEDIDLGRMQKELDIEYIPPALQRRSEDSGISPEQYILQSLFKGRMYSQIKRDAIAFNKSLMEIDFVIKCNSTANKLLKDKEKENGTVDFKDLQAAWDVEYKKMLEAELAAAARTGAPAAE